MGMACVLHVRVQAREEMVAIFSKVIANRRSGKVKSDDFLQKIIDFAYKDEVDRKTGKVTQKGRGFTDSEVTGWLIVLLFAGQHTSSITATWLGAMLLSNPTAMAEVKAEQEKMVPDEASLNYANLLGMDGMRRAITETLRLYPPLILLMRQVALPLPLTPTPTPTSCRTRPYPCPDPNPTPSLTRARPPPCGR